MSTALGAPFHPLAFQSPFPSVIRASQVLLVAKNPPASAGDLGDMGSIPGSGKFPGGKQATHTSILT